VINGNTPLHTTAPKNKSTLIFNAKGIQKNN
jgi:hypothetical protein